jgi:hypothetical protein
VPFCPVADWDAAVAGRDALPVRAPPDPLPVRAELAAVPPLTRAEPEPVDAVRPLAVPVRAPPPDDPVRAPPEDEPVRVPPVRVPLPAALTAPDPEDPEDPDDPGRAEFGRSEFCVARTGAPMVAPPKAPSAPTGSVVQFLNIRYCWPSVHRLVVTQ